MRISMLGLARKAPRLLLLLAALAVTAVALAPAPAALAVTERCGHEIDYYSDATYTHLVGMQTWLPTTCACQYFHSGTFSRFSKVILSVC
jgi:hypothetical protein